MAYRTLSCISKAYDATRVLNDVFLSVQDGAFLTLVGASGCGKSTLLRVVLGCAMVRHACSAIAVRHSRRLCAGQDEPVGQLFRHDGAIASVGLRHFPVPPDLKNLSDRDHLRRKAGRSDRDRNARALGRRGLGGGFHHPARKRSLPAADPCHLARPRRSARWMIEHDIANRGNTPAPGYHEIVKRPYPCVA